MKLTPIFRVFLISYAALAGCSDGGAGRPADEPSTGGAGGANVSSLSGGAGTASGVSGSSQSNVGGADQGGAGATTGDAAVGPGAPGSGGSSGGDHADASAVPDATPIQSDAPMVALPPTPPGGWCPPGDGGTSRPPFTPPPAGCGGETPGRRTAIDQQTPGRSTCPQVAVTEAAVEPNCPAANPNDDQPDDDALQTCLNRGGMTALPAGNPGFILAKGLKILTNGIILRGADPTKLARFVAAPTLHDTMIRGDTVTDIVVRYVELDGNRSGRTAFLPDCHDYRLFASGLVVRYSRNFALLDNHITHTLCGSALEVDGADFEVARNHIEWSGHGLEAKDAPEPWADGITLHNCFNGQVHDNLVVDSTDVGIVSGGGACSIVHNEVVNENQHTFGGITLHDFSLKGADHTGTVVAYNIVTGKNGMLGFGFSLGIHPWHGWPFQGLPAPYNTGGTVACNQVSGGEFNIEVDGVQGIHVVDNQIGATGGSPRCNGPATPYTSYSPHVLASTLQPGWTEKEFDGCIP
jgi:hypothetical protein